MKTHITAPCKNTKCLQAWLHTKWPYLNKYKSSLHIIFFTAGPYKKADTLALFDLSSVMLITETKSNDHVKDQALVIYSATRPLNQ
jgi:hypothetical protein